MDARIIAAGDTPAGGEHVIHQRIDLPFCQRVIEAITIGKLLRLQIRRQQTQRQVILQHADPLAAQVAPVRQRIGLQAVDAPQRAPHRQRGALHRIAVQRLHQLQHRLLLTDQRVRLTRIADPHRFKLQAGALSYRFQQIHAIASGGPAGIAITPGIVVRFGGVSNTRMIGNPGAFSGAEHQGLRILIARQGTAPARLQRVHQFCWQLTQALINPADKLRIAGDRAQVELSCLDV